MVDKLTNFFAILVAIAVFLATITVALFFLGIACWVTLAVWAHVFAFFA